MNITAQHILNEVSRLSPIERAEIIERIIESFDTEPDPDIQKVWVEEAEKRLALHNDKPGKTLSEEEVFGRIEKEK